MADQPAWKLGQDIEIHCRYCRLNLDGVVAALGPDGGLLKVQCRTCRHFQDYKAPTDPAEKRAKLVAKAMRIAERHTAGQGGTKASAKKAAPAAADLSPEAVLRKLWEDATKDASPLRMKVYDRHRMYKVDDLLAHKAHGLGQVREVSDGEMVVLFREGFVRLEMDQPREED
jgi:hypothetical protein